MKAIPHSLLLALAGITLCSMSPLRAAEIDPQTAEITKTAEAFVEAFHKGDAKAVAAFWTPDGDYVDENSRVLKGQKAIEDSFAQFFAANKGLKLRIDVASLRFPAPDLAIEDGTSTVMAPDGSAPSRARYTNVLIKKDGKWLLSSVREAAYSEPTNYEHLKDLEWAIGEWADQEGKGPVGRVSFEWAPGQNFIVAMRGVEFKDNILDNGTEWIGWDPVTKQIHSWSFEADGGYSDSVWTKDGKNWVVKANSTLSDGNKVSATHIITPVDDNTVTWQSKGQTLNGKLLPDTKEIKMKRAD
jgi:uncharacterized protein (TIGR02246 family)